MSISATTSALKRAAIYLRVSTSAQADRDVDPERFSIPAQRDACQRKAESLAATVVDEYIDRGESARSTARPALQAMLKRIREQRDIDYVIVHKVDRLARSRVDDVTIGVTLKNAGANLVSVSENIDDTPAGMFMHAIMAGMAEFYSCQPRYRSHQRYGAESQERRHALHGTDRLPQRANIRGRA